jgi:hypothetical protein
MSVNALVSIQYVQSIRVEWTRLLASANEYRVPSTEYRVPSTEQQLQSNKQLTVKGKLPFCGIPTAKGLVPKTGLPPFAADTNSGELHMAIPMISYTWQSQ